MNLTAEERESAEILRISSLPADEQALVEHALPGGSHVSCDAPPDDSPWGSLAHRPEREKAYVGDQGTFYGLWLRITDMLFIDIAPSPSNETLEKCQ